jgi:hypothetical protein
VNVHEPVSVYIGFDQKQAEAYAVTACSLRRRASVPVKITPVDSRRLAGCGLLRRPTDLRGAIYDIHSNAECSTEFAISRFLVPHLAQTGFALFVDCDVVFLADVAELFALADKRYAVQVVAHEHIGGGKKMDGRNQSSYPRKNQSSVMIFNCDHTANQRLSIQDVNERPGRDLHRFYWLNDAEIGPLPMEWNWLVGVKPKPANPKLAHFTLGVPGLTASIATEHDSIWINERAQ